MRRGLWAFALAMVIATAGHAQLLQRQFPANAKLGELAGGQPFPLVQIGGKPLRLAPGSRIIDEHNRSITHGHLPQQAYVLFVADMNGAISSLYLLRSDELERVKQRAR